MIDRDKRDHAAKLVRQFRDGQITSDDLESEWPDNPDDRALEEISSTVWLFYDDFRPRRIAERDDASPGERELLSRYATFLDSDFEYDWPKFPFIRISGLGVLVPLSLGLLAPVDRWIKARNAKFDAEMAAHGDTTVWPFVRKADYSEM